MPVLPSDSYDSLVGKFVATQRGQMLVERVDHAGMMACGRLFSDPDLQMGVKLETILDSEVTEVDWRDPEVIERYLAGEHIVDDVRLDTPPPAVPAPCSCQCGQRGGCYRLQQQGVKLGHYRVSSVGCSCADGPLLCDCRVTL